MIEFTPDLLSYLHAADVVVSMGDYNTITEILSLRKRAVVVPRVNVRTEQLIRAERRAAPVQKKKTPALPRLVLCANDRFGVP